MYKESLFVIIMIYTKTVICSLLGLETEETTPEPMDIRRLEQRVVCKFQPNGYDCGEKGVRNYDWYYFDLKLEDCKTIAVVGDCGDNDNAFSSLASCKQSCRDIGQLPIGHNLTANIYCRLQFDFGDCNEYHPMWFFDVSTRTCKGFSYSGCGGNQNKFLTTEDCTTACIPHVEYKNYYSH